VIDGVAVILGAEGMSDFNALHSGKKNEEVQLCAFDVLGRDGNDLREWPLTKRKAKLERQLRGRPDCIFVNGFEVGAIGPDLFSAACSMGLEGLVSKRSDRPYRGGRPKSRPTDGSGMLRRKDLTARDLRTSCVLVDVADREHQPITGSGNGGPVIARGILNKSNASRPFDNNLVLTSKMLPDGGFARGR
jgi:hypothetical protein